MSENVPAIARSKILVVEDERDIRDLMLLHLKREGFFVDEAADGEEALKKHRETQFDLYIFDWMLPGISGLDLTKMLRVHSGPILMVTAKAQPMDIVLGLESGADDYITKPFEIPVFLARVRALLRRGHKEKQLPNGGAPDNLVRVGKLELRLGAHEVRCGGAQIPVTPSEFKLLTALLQNEGKVLTRSRLIELVQGTDVSVVDRTVDTHVFGLRKKLGDCGSLIETVRGVGYRVKGTE